MKFSLTTKLGFLSFGGVYLALAVILGSLYVLRAEGRLIKQLDEVGATFFREPFIVNNFELIDQNSQEYTLENLRGDWNLVFFGFTSCPDICPLTMGELDKFVRSWSESEQDPKPKIARPKGTERHTHMCPHGSNASCYGAVKAHPVSTGGHPSSQ